MKILICGHRAYAARGLGKLLKANRYDVLCFSRSKDGKDRAAIESTGDKVILGNVLEVDGNQYLLSEKIDVIINFILMEGASEEDNLKYVRALCRLANKVGAQKLIHMSSISSYANDEKLITESTPIDSHPEWKGCYGAIKVKVDNLLLECKMNTRVVMMRPGFITAPDKKNALAGIAKILPGGFALLMGNKKSTLPLCKRDDLHQAMLDAIESKNPKPVYVLVGNGEGTKYSYLKQTLPEVKVIKLPKFPVVGFAWMLKVIKVFDERKYQMVKGLFKVQKFNVNS